MYQAKLCDSTRRQCASCKVELYYGAKRSNRDTFGKLKAHRISPKIRYEIYKKHCIYLQDHQNFCVKCLSSKVDDLSFDYTIVESEVPDYISLVLQQVVKEHNQPKFARKDLAYIYYEDVKLNFHHRTLTGLTFEEKDLLIARVEDNNNNNNANEIKPQHLLLFLTLIYQGINEALTGLLFGYAKSSVSKIIKRVADILSRLYVPTELGASAWNRDKVLENVPDYVDILFPEKNVVAIADGGYIEIGKSGDFEYQQKSYCSHKYFNCFKPMVVSTMNGKIINIYGFFYSNGYNSDSHIWDTIVNNNNNIFDLNEILDVNLDAVIVDRGFRYCTTNGHENNGYKLIMPYCLKQNQKQLTKEQANFSRKVTKLRWPIECIMHHIKLWKFFRSKCNVLYGSDFIWNVLKIVCSIYNTFRSPIIKPKLYNSLKEDANEIMRMIENVHENDIVNVELQTNVGWYQSSILALKSLHFFPRYTLNDIKKWNHGPYQLILALKYIKHATDIKIWANDNHPNTIKFTGVLSRYSSNKTRRIYLRFIPGIDDSLQDGVLAWCSCYNGQRTIGGCAHVIAMLYKILLVISNDNEEDDYYNNDETINDNPNSTETFFSSVLDCAQLRYNGENIDNMDDISDGNIYTDIDQDNEDMDEKMNNNND